MPIKLFARIRLRRGLFEDLPQPLLGSELGWAVDNQTLWIGNGTLAEGAPEIGNTQICTVKPVLTAFLEGVQSSSASTTLHTAANFAVLAGVTITNTGASIITGDVGAVSSITGMNTATITGTVHTPNDAPTIAALLDATSAYNTLSVLTSLTLVGDLGGKTLTPGVYSYPSSAGLTGTLTLDFQNLSNQQIVIITGSTLTTASASVVNIINSNPTNQVYWVIGSSATLGTTTSFAGTILAQVSITLNTGANIVNGNALALTGSVTLQDDAISIPTSATPPVSFLNLPIAAFGSTAFIKYTLTQSNLIGTAGFASSTSIPDVPPLPILHTASTFAVLAGASITNTGPSAITGDVGAVSSITPGPWTVTGTVHTVNDTVTQQALTDANSAFTYLNSQPTTHDLTGQDLGSVGTLHAGVYNYSSSAQLTGTLTLDFQGLSNQNIIFKIGSTLTTASASVVNIINSNPTNNVFFVVGSSATLGTTTAFAGTILANVSITLNTGATIANGNAIALTGSVSMDTDTINVAPPPPAPTGVLGIDGSPTTASATIQDITYTAVNPGINGNLINIAYSGGGTAGSEVVTVIGNTISVQIQSGASTAAQIASAIAGSTGPSAPTAVLNTAATFAALAGASITNTGSSIITGDIGAVSSITPGAWTVTGTVHAVNDSATTAALVDANNAYTHLTSQITTQDLTGQDLGGLTLTPGVYNYSSSAGLTGTLTLDFQNLSHQNIIFKIGSTLTTASASTVNIVNSNPTNSVFWAVGSSATLGTTTSFKGTIVANTSITLNTGAIVANGNALALTGSVTMQSNTINIAPSTPGASALVTAVANIPTAHETAPVASTFLTGGSGVNIFATETLAQIAMAINAANIPNIVASIVYFGGSYHLQLTDTSGAIIQISSGSTASLLTALGLTLGSQPVAVQIGTLSLIQNSDTTVFLNDTNSSNTGINFGTTSPLGVTFSAGVSGGSIVLYYTSAGAASVMRYKTDEWLIAP